MPHALVVSDDVVDVYGLKPNHAVLRAANASESTDALEVLDFSGSDALLTAVPH